MAVGLRGYTQGSVAGVGTSIAWPAGSTAGDMALIHCDGSYANNGPQTDGWNPVGYKCHWKILTSADVATALIVNATHVKLQVFTGARGIGRTDDDESLTIQGAGSYLFVEASRSGSGSIAPATYRLGTEWTNEIGQREAAYARAADAGYTAIYLVEPDATSYAYEVLPASVPSPPTLTAPAAGASVDQTLALTFGWEHQSSFPQTGRRVRVTWESWVWWIDGAGALQTTEQSVATASTTATLNAAALTAGATYTWAVATQDANGWSAYSAERSLNPIAPPTISSVTVSSPADDLSPTVTWAATAGYGVLTAHQVWICNAADADPTVAPLWTSGVLPNAVSPDTAPSSTPWVNGASLKAWVRVWQTGGVSRTLSSAAFTVSWTPPSTPTVTASAASSPPTVSVSGLTAGNVVEIQQQLDGVTWTPLTTRVAVGTSITGIPSPLAATGASVSFRARRANLVDGVLLQSAWSTVASITATPSGGCYVVDDNDRSVYLACHLESDGPREIVQSVSVAYGLGATSARVDRTPEAGERGSVVWVTDTATDRDALLAWLDAHAVFWIVFPPEDGLATPAKRVARTSPRSWERLAQVAIPHRLIPMSWVEQP